MRRFTVYAMVFIVSVVLIIVAVRNDGVSEKGIVPKVINQQIEGPPPQTQGADYILQTNPSTSVIYTSSEEVTFYGKVSLSSAMVSINDRPLDIGKDGSFKLMLVMHPGENRFVFVYEDVQSGKREEKTFHWIVDTVAPEFQLTKPFAGASVPYAQSEIEIKGDFFLPDTDSQIEQGITVQANGTRLDIDKKRRGFSGIIHLADGHHEINVVAEDAAGNKAKKSITVNIDTTPPIISIKGFKVVRDKGMLPLIRIHGTINEAAELRFAGRPISVDEKGSFQLDIYPFETDIARQKKEQILVAEDRAGNKGFANLPQGGDFIPPHWISLKLVAIDKKRATLLGKVNEPAVQVKIGEMNGISDADGLVRIKNVPFDLKHPVVTTVLKDGVGNTSHIEQWVAIFSEKN